MTTALRFSTDAAHLRNARLALQNRVEGLVSLLDDPVVIEEGADFLEVQLSDDLPEEELQAAIRTLANLVGRPGSGITELTLVSPEVRDGLQRVYSV